MSLPQADQDPSPSEYKSNCPHSNNQLDQSVNPEVTLM